MGITIATVRAALNTSTGNQDITTSKLGGLTPKAALFIVTQATADATTTANSQICIGAATGTSNRWAMAVNAEDAQASTDTDAGGSLTHCILMGTPGDGATEASADFVAFITNGVRINIDDAPVAAHLCTVVLFAGSDLSAYVDSPTSSATADTGTLDVTAPGFEPDVLILARSRSTSSWDIRANMGVGIVENDGTDPPPQHSVGYDYRNNQTSVNLASGMTSTYGLIEVTTSTGAISHAWEFNTFDSSGFTIENKVDGASKVIPYLALAFGGAANFGSGLRTMPAGTGNQSITTGWKPQFVLQLLTDMLALDTAYTDDAAGPQGISVMDDTDAYCNSITDDDAAADSASKSRADSTPIHLLDHAAASDLVSTFVSFDSTSWTENVTNTVNGALAFWLAIEEYTAAAGTLLKVPMTGGMQELTGGMRG